MRFASWKRQICYSTSQKCKSLDPLGPTLGSGILFSKATFINHRTNGTRLLKVPVLLSPPRSRLFLSHCVLQTQCVCVQHYFTPSAGSTTHVVRVCADTVGHAEKMLQASVPTSVPSHVGSPEGQQPTHLRKDATEPCWHHALAALGLSSARLPARMRDRVLVEAPSEPNPAAATWKHHQPRLVSHLQAATANFPPLINAYSNETPSFFCP